MDLFVKAVALLVLMSKFQVSLGAVYKVGDSAGWTTIGNINYKQWAAAKTFQVGDIIRKFLSDNFHGNSSGFWVMINLVVYLWTRFFQVASFFIYLFIVKKLHFVFQQSIVCPLSLTLYHILEIILKWG